MMGVDTNVLVRFLIDEDKVQNQKARAFMLARRPDDPAFVSGVALVETIWILHRKLGYPMPQILAVLRDLLASDAIVVEFTEELDALLREDQGAKTGIADHVIAWTGARAGCRATVTFDRVAARDIPGMELLA